MKNKKSKICIATVTWARNLSEKKIILKTLKMLSELGYPIVVADERNAATPLTADLKKIKNVKVFTASGFDKKAKLSLSRAAAISDYIFWIEADKFEFAKNHAKNFINHYLKNPCGTLLPGRSASSFFQYPKFQQTLEKFLFYITAELLSKPLLDVCYGPRIFPSVLVEFLSHLKRDIGFGFQAYLLAINSRLNLPVNQINYKISPPPDIQSANVIKLYRLQQAQDWIEGLNQGLGVNKNLINCC